MSTEDPGDDATHHELLERKRDVVVQRLVRTLDALDHKRHAVTEAVEGVASFVTGSSPPSRPPSAGADSTRLALYGAAAGGAVVALGLLLEHRRRERNRPLRVLQRAWLEYVTPRPPSTFVRLVTGALGSLFLAVAQDAAREGLPKLLDALAADDAPGGPARQRRTAARPA